MIHLLQTKRLSVQGREVDTEVTRFSALSMTDNEGCMFLHGTEKAEKKNLKSFVLYGIRITFSFLGPFIP